MKIFTIDNDNNISVFATAEEAAASTTTTLDTFASQKELTQLAGAWPAERLAAVWNSLSGVNPVQEFKSAKVAAGRIWERVQNLGGAANPDAELAKPKAAKKAKGGAPAAKGVPAKGKVAKKATATKKTPKAKKAAKKRKTPRGSKIAQVVAMAPAEEWSHAGGDHREERGG